MSVSFGSIHPESAPDPESTPPVETTECAICLNEIAVGSSVLDNFPDCRHRFHEECARGWVVSKGMAAGCPMCRRPFSVQDKQALLAAQQALAPQQAVVYDPDAQRAEANARFDQLKHVVGNFVNTTNEPDLVTTIIECLDDEKPTAVETIYKFASRVTGNPDDFDFFVEDGNWQLVEGNWNEYPAAIEIFITLQLINFALDEQTPFSGIPGALNLDENERVDGRRIYQAINVAAFNERTRNPILQRAIVRACRQAVHNKMVEHTNYYFSALIDQFEW